jgi:hypothetical protein
VPELALFNTVSGRNFASPPLLRQVALIALLRLVESEVRTEPNQTTTSTWKRPLKSFSGLIPPPALDQSILVEALKAEAVQPIEPRNFSGLLNESGSLNGKEGEVKNKKNLFHGKEK